MNPLVKVSVSLLVATKKDEEEGVFLAKCPFLNIVTPGMSEKEALENLVAEIEFFFSTCGEDETFTAVLNERTRKSLSPSASEDFVFAEPHYVSVPTDISPEIIKLIADAAVSGA